MRGVGRGVELVADAGRAGDEVAESVAVGRGELEGRGLFVEPERGDVKVVLREHGRPPQMLGQPSILRDVGRGEAACFVIANRFHHTTHGE